MAPLWPHEDLQPRQVTLPQDISLNKYSIEYSYEELRCATGNFADSQRLGKGAFGAVYRGLREDGTEVAVKVIDVPAKGGFEEEVRVLSRFRHPNLVILQGFARRGPQRLLVYELMEGGDVFRRLWRSSQEGLPFMWRGRVGAAFDASCGLSHLHSSTPKAFHRDIKSANILLDRNGTAKMADFGLACLSHKPYHRVAEAAGTPGYACPIYARRGVVTEGSEVFSFGVVLLELLTASPPTWAELGPGGIQQQRYLVSAIRGEACVALRLADQKAAWPQHVAASVAELALRCTRIEEELRPDFAKVVQKLRGLRDAPEALGPAVEAAPPAARAQPLAAAMQDRPGLAAKMAAAASKEVPLPEVAWSPGAGLADAFADASDAAARPQLLWSLVCTYADGHADEPMVLEHWQEHVRTTICPLTVGRALQEDLFDLLLPCAETRGMISREHFQIWAEPVFDVAGASDPAVLRCAFFLTNLSSNCTLVNGTLLDDKGKCCRLRSGDRICLCRNSAAAEGLCYTPFIQFCFDLSGSALRDVEEGAAEALPKNAAPLAEEAPVDAAAVPEEAPDGAAAPGAEEAAAAAPVHETRLCTALRAEVVPEFLLEAGGSAVRADAPGETRRIVHGPLAQGPAGGPFPPLVLGRWSARDFWRALLVEEAYHHLSREHFVLEPPCDGGRGAAVRNLSQLWPIRIIASSEAEAAMLEGEPRCLAALPGAEQQARLHSGDVIVVNPSSSCRLWFRFQDLSDLQGPEGTGGSTLGGA